MLVVYIFISLLYVNARCSRLLAPRNDLKIPQCIVGILEKYFAEKKELTYVNMDPSNDEDILRQIHSTMKFSLVSRISTEQSLSIQNQGYVIFSANVDTFVDYFVNLIRERYWNPYARFLIIIEKVPEAELRRVFDELLRQHVNNVVVLNGTSDGHLYTYNPFDKYACGRYYDDIIRYGVCLEAKQDLYPNKLVTGLRNCTFRGSVGHAPPFTIHPRKNEYRNGLTGMEQYIIKIAGELDGFRIDVKFNYNNSIFGWVAPNMTFLGPMDKLQKNETDVIFGSLMVTATRAAAFSSLTGYHDYVDEFKFAVQKASFVPNWKYFYLEFDAFVWFLLLVSLIVYSFIMVVLLQTDDKGAVILGLLDNLLLHGRDIRSSFKVKCVLMMWIWFAYLVNTFYQSSLVSLTTNPSKEYQIADEADMFKYNVRPCLGRSATFLYTEKSKKNNFEQTKIRHEACENATTGIKLVGNNKGMYTLIPSYFYLYNKQTYNNKWGEPMIHYFERPYSKLMLSYYFYKGFPISRRLRTTMLYMRESGLADKNLRDQYFSRSIKFKFSQKEFETRFVCPWYIYVAGCSVATLSLIIELISHYLKRERFDYR